MDLDATHPAISDLRRTARRRVPRFVWEYLDSATGDEVSVGRARAALDEVRLMPHALRGSVSPDLGVSLFGRHYNLPVGIAPVGMSGLVWPGAEAMLARAGAAAGIPYCMSTVAAATPEEVGPHMGGMGWYQLYAPRDYGIRDDILARAREAGFHTMILTVDVPAASRRERLRRARITNPMKMTAPVVIDAALHPRWALATLQSGIPGLKTLEPYAKAAGNMPGTAHIGYMIRTAPDMQYLEDLRGAWDGPLLVKGILSAKDAVAAVQRGADGVWVSGHGGRQFDGGPAPIRQLPQIRAALGPEVPVIYDTGVRSGLDVLRALALGADMCMAGLAFHYGVAAFQEAGAAHVAHIFKAQLEADLAQLGCATLADLPGHLIRTSA
ncbi:MAG: alpha-hydroxy acid oxidase [Pseudomonadota bacterium]